MSTFTAQPAGEACLLRSPNILPNFRGQRPDRNPRVRPREFPAPGNKPCQPGLVSRQALEGARTSERNAFPTVSELDLAARNRLLMEHLPQVRYIARRIRDRLPAYVQLEDLVHAGVLGLMEALRRYDPNKHVEFKSFAQFRIQGAILDSLRELDWAPRALRKRGRDLERAQQKLRNRLGRPPTEPELAAELRIDLQKLQRLVNSLSGATLHSLQQEIGAGEFSPEESRSNFLVARTDDPFTICLSREISRLLARAVADLPPRERRVLALYYYQERTMKEVARALGVCESRVSQIHSAALVPLRSRLGELLASKPAPRHVGCSQPADGDPRAEFAQTPVV